MSISIQTRSQSHRRRMETGAEAEASPPPWYDPLDAGWTIKGAWQGIAAASYAASKVNLPNPGTYDLYEHNTETLNWSAEAGWSGFADATACLYGKWSKG